MNCPIPPPRMCGAEVQVVCEATGGYERAVMAALHQAGIAVSVLNPALVRHPRVRGTRVPQMRDQRAKTDWLDAAVLSAYAHALKPKPTSVRSALEQQLAELIRRRGQLVDTLVMLRQQAQQLSPSVERDQSLVRRLERDLEQVETQLQQLLPVPHMRDGWAGSASAPERPMARLQQHWRWACPRKCGASALHGCAGGPHVREQTQYSGHFTSACVQLAKLSRPFGGMALTAVMGNLVVLMNHVLKYPNFALAN